MLSRLRTSDDRGSATVELVLLTPVLVTLVLFAVLLGRLGAARLQVDSAARQAARAASIARTPEAARRDADTTAAQALAAEHITCMPSTVDVDLTDYRPSGVVTVRVTCTVSLAQLGLLHLPGSRTLTASFTSPVDVFRAAGAGP